MPSNINHPQVNSTSVAEHVFTFVIFRCPGIRIVPGGVPMSHPQITVLACSFVASYLLAAEFGFDLFQVLLSFLVQLPFRCFILVFTILNPLVQEASHRQGFTCLLRAWNFAVDCVIAGNESVVLLLDKLGIDDEVL